MDALEIKNRRPLKTRQTRWASALGRIAGRSPLSANGISVLGIGFSVAGFGSCLHLAFQEGHAVWWIVVAICIQARLLCNMLDGLVAVEGGRFSPTGVLFNEAPDRIEDVLFLLGAGLAAGFPWGLHLGWLCAVLALGTAYVRVLGGSLGFEQDFCGPMAKQHRMFLLTLAALGAFVERSFAWENRVLHVALFIIALGCMFTVARRLYRIAALLKSQP